MAEFNVPFDILQGETYDKTSTWSAGTPLVPIDLTGATARLQARSKKDSNTVLLDLTTENGGIELGGAAGTIRRFINDADTAAIQWVAGVYDLEIVFPNNTVRRLMGGDVTVSKEVTRV